MIVGVRDDFAARIVLASIKSSIRARSVGTGISSNSPPELGAAWTRSPGRERAVAWVRLLAAPDCDTDLVSYEMTRMVEAVGEVLTPAVRAQSGF